MTSPIITSHPATNLSQQEEMPLPLEELLPLRTVVITLQCTSQVNLPFMDHEALYQLIQALLSGPATLSEQACKAIGRSIFFMTDERHYCPYLPMHQYRFQITVLNGSEVLLDTLLTSLQKLYQFDDCEHIPPTLLNKLAFYSAKDFFSHKPVSSSEECTVWGSDQLTEEALFWQGRENIIWEWLAPARLPLPDSHNNNLNQNLCRSEADFDSRYLLKVLYGFFNHLIRNHTAQDYRPPKITIPSLNTAKADLFWLTLPDKKTGLSNGGLLGQVLYTGTEYLAISWWQLLILGQYCGFHLSVSSNQYPASEYHHYRLSSLEQDTPFQPAKAQNKLTQLVGSTNNLHTALNHVRKHSHQTDSDSSKESTDKNEWKLSEYNMHSAYDYADDQAVLETLKQHLQEIQCDHYQTPALQGWLIEKHSGGYRPLSVPPFIDRVLQRAVAQKLTPVLDRLMSCGSYGYRPRRSRRDAMEQIQKAVRSGYCWVFESDIKDFFDSINLEHLATRLNALFGQQPVIRQIIHWMTADVHFQGERITRKQGLPQGSPLSPLMANLMLDDFDRSLEQAGFKLIRFADDFVVMCRNPEEARAARYKAEQSLKGLNLSLNQQKTFIREMKEGLRYLGYLFINDMVLDVGGEKAPDTGKPKPISSISWLAKISEHKLHRLNAEPSQQDIQTIIEPEQHFLSTGEKDDTGSVLCITGKTCVLHTRQARLEVFRDEECILDLPWSHLQSVVLFGNHHITTPALKQGMLENVAIHLADSMGHYQGTCWDGRGINGHHIWFRQHARFQDPAESLAAAKALVKLRIKQCIGVLRKRQLPGIDELKAYRKQLDCADNLQRLNGYEGAAAACYFKAIAGYIPQSFGFKGRNRRPPKDPFNVLLSLGYTLLYGYVDSLIRVSGMLPMLGFYHQPHGTHSTLASDLMEPFRHRVERKALSLIRKGQIKPEHFHLLPDGCVIEDRIRRFYLAELVNDFETPEALAGFTLDSNKSERLTDQILEQNKQMIRWINEGVLFNPK